MVPARPILPEPDLLRRTSPVAGADAHDERVEAASFEALYAAAFPKVYGFMRCQVATVDVAQELVSRVFLKAYRHRQKAPQGEGAIPWVFRIAQTTLIDYWRVEKRRERASLPIDEIAKIPASSNHAAAYERKRQISDLWQMVSDLPEEDRVLLALKFAAHRTNRDIAVILNLSEGAVSMRLLRSLRRLRERLHNIGWE